MQDGRPEAVRTAAPEQLNGSSAQPNSVKQDAKEESERADEANVGTHQDPCRAEGGAGGPVNGNVRSGSIGDEAGGTTEDGRAAVTQGSSAATTSAAPSSSSNAPEQSAEISHAYMQIADEANSGWTTVKPSRRMLRRQAENVEPASLHQATASVAAVLLETLPPLSVSRATAPKARSPEPLQRSHDSQVRRCTIACSAHNHCDTAMGDRLDVCDH